MGAHGYTEVQRGLLYRQVTAAITSDLIHFSFEALVAAAKGKLTVAFALLRKLFKENLAILEWLLSDPVDFLDRFEGNVPSEHVWKALSPERRKELIANALLEIDLPVFEADFIYDIRYSKNRHYSLEKLWQKATHLVTSFSGLETEPGNFNFIFSSPAARDEQWDAFYRVVPSLLLYSLAVAESVMGRFVEWEPERAAVKRWLRILAFVRHSEQVEDSDFGELPAVDSLALELETLLDAVCDRCGVAIPLDRPNIDRLWSAAELQCVSCGAFEDLWAGIFPDDGDSTADSS